MTSILMAKKYQECIAIHSKQSAENKIVYTEVPGQDGLQEDLPALHPSNRALSSATEQAEVVVPQVTQTLEERINAQFVSYVVLMIFT